MTNSFQQATQIFILEFTETIPPKTSTAGEERKIKEFSINCLQNLKDTDFITSRSEMYIAEDLKNNKIIDSINNKGMSSLLRNVHYRVMLCCLRT